MGFWVGYCWAGLGLGVGSKSRWWAFGELLVGFWLAVGDLWLAFGGLVVRFWLAVGDFC